MNKTKKNLVIALSFSMLACVTVGAVGMYGIEKAQASTSTEAVFAMQSGASIRIEDETGIRWKTTINETYYNALNVGSSKVELGVLVAPKSNADLTESTSDVMPIPCTKTLSFDANGEFTYYSSILYPVAGTVVGDFVWTEELLEKAYSVELTARAYIKVGNEYTFVDEYKNTTRSMRAVAYEALDYGYTETEVGVYFGDITESDIASGYYSEMDKKATLTNVNNLADGRYSASVKAQPVEVLVSGATMTVSGALSGLTAGENYKLSVFSDEAGTQNNVYVQDFTYVTLAIDEASDLDIFHYGGDKNSWEETGYLDGYYVLVKDIDMTDSVFNTTINIKSPMGVKETALTAIGLRGVFDGNGYTIKNLSPVLNSVGLFAAINGGTVKNVAICNAEQPRENRAAYLASIIRNATFDNVYIYAGSSMNFGSTYVLCKYIIDSKFTNCVFEGLNAGSLRNTLFYQIVDTEGGSGTVFKDCYFLNNRTLSSYDAYNDNGLPKVDASNKKPAEDTSETVWLDGIKRYATIDEMVADKANNDYKSFENYWDVTSGMPVWKNAETAVVLCDKEGNAIGNTISLKLDESVEFVAKKNGVVCDNPIVEIKENGGNVAVEGAKVTLTGAGESTILVKYAANGNAYEKEIIVSLKKEEVVYEKTLTFSAKDGLFFDGANVVSIDTILGEGVELSSVEHATDTLTLSNGAILGLTTNGKSVTTTQIVLNTLDKRVTVNVNAYTLVIDEASDMNLFHHGGKNPLTGGNFDDSFFTEEQDKFDGYYILVKDIDMSKSKFATAQSFRRSTYIGSSNLQNVGLTGTFDGNGYRLYNFAPIFNGGPLFSAINGTVKNVSITNDKGTGNFSFTTYFAGVIRNATIENVYVDANYDLSLSVTTDKTSPSRYVSTIVGSTFKNCIFVDKTTDADYISLAKYISGTPSFTDCYFISKAKVGQLYVDSAWKVHDASNQTADYKLAGIKRYESATAMEEAEVNNAFTSFAESGYWTVETGKVPVWKTKA